MRAKILLMLLVILGVLNSNAQQIANGSFENWTSAAPVPSSPVSWDNYDRLVYVFGGGAIPVRPWCTKETTPANVYAGSASAKLMTDTTTNIGKIEGTVFYGNVVLVGQQPHYYGTPFTSRPLTLNGALKFAPNGADTATYSLKLTKWDAIGDSAILVGYDGHAIVSTGGSWVYFTDTITYLSAQTPDTIYLQFSSGYNNNAKVGTILWVDSVTVQGTAAAPSVGVTISKTDVTCYGQSTGTVTANATGGSNYTYSWSNGSTDMSQSNLPAGPYSVTVTSAGVTASASTNINQPASPLDVNVTTTASTCGNSTGTATAVVGGNPPVVTYVWSVAGTTATITGLAANSYSVTVTSGGCTATGSGVVANSNGPTATFNNTEPLCYFSTNGNIVVSANGGNPPYSYAWGGSAVTTDSLPALGAGTYYVTVTDHGGCQFIGSDSLGQPNFVGDYLQSTPSSGSNGTAWAAPYGGTPPYTYAWTGGGSTDTITGLAPGNYTITVTDSHGCTDSRSVQVTAGAALQVSFTNVEPSCFMSNDGEVIANASGGTGPYHFMWSNQSTTDTLKNAGSATYWVTVTDANNTTVSASDSLGQPNFVGGQLSTTPTLGTDGTATIVASGGTSPYTYLWSNSQTGTTATGLSSGNISVTITDAHGCTDVQSGSVPVGINEVGNIFSGITLSPNPANSQIRLTVTVEGVNDVQIRVTDVTGKFVYTSRQTISGILTHNIDVSQFSDGIYIMEVTAGNASARTKFVVAR